MKNTIILYNLNSKVLFLIFWSIADQVKICDSSILMRLKPDMSDVNVTNKEINSDYFFGISLVFGGGTSQQLEDQVVCFNSLTNFKANLA